MRCCYGLEASVAPNFTCYSPNAHHDGIWRSGLWEVTTRRLSHENGGRARRPCPGACSRSLCPPREGTARGRPSSQEENPQWEPAWPASEAQRGLLLSVKR